MVIKPGTRTAVERFMNIPLCAEALH